MVCCGGEWIGGVYCGGEWIGGVSMVYCDGEYGVL